MTNNAVPYHTIHQLLAVLGVEQQAAGFHTFYRKEPTQQIPIWYPFRTDYFTFLLVLQGSLSIKLNLLDYVITQNQLLITVPSDVRQFEQVSEDCQFMGIGFTPSFLSQTGIYKNNIEVLELFSGQLKPLLSLEPSEAEALKHLFFFLYEKRGAATEQLYHEEMIHHGFSALLYEVAYLFRTSNRMAAIKLTRKEDLTIRFLKLLPLHFKEERSVQHYAAQLYVTPKYLSQTVKEVTGKTAGAFIDEMVMMEAKVLLSNSSLSIAQVAEALHFSDQFFFSKYFKQHAGKSPTDYRNSL